MASLMTQDLSGRAFKIQSASLPWSEQSRGWSSVRHNGQRPKIETKCANDRSRIYPDCASPSRISTHGALDSTCVCLDIVTPGSLSRVPTRRRRFSGSFALRLRIGEPQRPQNSRK